ncbi:MAG: CDP-archaeol synthase [Burkholderiaceae bacterium]|nr:CDP-archaeol synthase [Burkholderiaceae bacterium]
MDDLWLGARLLLLLGVANSAPIVIKRLLGTRWSTPLDAGYPFFDGRPLLGPSKTLRGYVAAVAATAVVATLLDFSPVLGAKIGALAMAGDTLSSFVKRRFGIASSGRATGLDQIPEALLPLLVLRNALDLSLPQIAAITLVFFALEIPLSRVFFSLGLRDRPY